MSTKPIQIDFDVDQFDPMRITTVTHNLADHPMLQLPALVELGRRQAAAGRVRKHGDDAAAGTDFIKAVDLHPKTESAEEIIANIENAKAFLSLLHVQRDPVYRPFVNEVLDAVLPKIAGKDPGMHGRSAWIFVTSPNAVTPFHIDHEHNFILQIRGEKTVHVFDPLDRTVLSEEALEEFHRHNSRELVVFRDEFQRRANSFHFKPGVGAYIPTTAPHWVKNHDNVSITMSFTYYTDATRRRERLYMGNQLLRKKLRMTPTPVGHSPLLDLVKDQVYKLPLRVIHGRAASARPVEA
jgi:hypothetical protein